MESTYTVTGMTCGHCVGHITEEMKTVDGVTDVRITLEDGVMVVTSDAPLDFATVEEAVSEAGDYQVTAA
ncbi:MAG TPA: heavy metal-associated domain-containing protein [Propionibacteriaceae bacterium]|nr:heavy metal-associated domain-containing protein [Propionibacteriaceae bacterium]HPZ50617.1 heavy metal-associated domain-containing protein [Propionibacteriaceae bacterium]